MIDLHLLWLCWGPVLSSFSVAWLIRHPDDRTGPAFIIPASLVCGVVTYALALSWINTAPEDGWSTHMEGPWHVEGQTLVFVPETGLRRRWRGDEHRHQHGEDVPYTSRQEPLHQSPRRVPITSDAAGRLSFPVPELGATFYREVDGQPPPPCSDERPMPF